MGSPLDLGQPGHSSWFCFGFITPPRSSCLVRNLPGPIRIDLARVKDSRPTDAKRRQVISRNASRLLLLALTVLVALTAVLLPRIPQPQSYHLFADERSVLGIPHFADVISNFPFAVGGT